MFRFWFPWKHPGGIEWPEMGSMMSVTSFWLTLNRFYRFFWCFHCWLWTSKYRLAYFRFLVRVGKKLKLGTLKILVKNIRRHSNKSTEISSNLCQSIDQYTVMSSVKIIKRVFTMWNFIPGWTHPCRWWNVSYCLHVFAEMKFHPWMKKDKKTCKQFIPGWNFKMSMLFKFLTYVFKYVFQIQSVWT